MALPAIGEHFGTDPGLLTQLLVNSYLVVGIVLLSPGGKLGDRWGAGRALAVGQALFGAGAALGLAGLSVAWLVVARTTMAAGGALIGPATMALLRNGTTPLRRARVFGTFGAAMGLAAAVGPPLGGALVQAFGWRSIFLVNLPLLAVAALLLRRMRIPAPGSRSVRFDWTGTLLLGSGLTAAVIGTKLVGAAALALLLGGLGLLAAFVRWERRVQEPVLDPKLFLHRAFTAGGAIVALHNMAMYALLFQLPIWFDRLTEGGGAQVGPVLLAMLLGMVVCAPLGGRVSERVGARAVSVTGTLTGLAGMLLLTDVSAVRTPSDAVLPLALLGVGLGFASAPAQASALSAVTREQSGMASGALSTLRYLGGVMGIGALGIVLRGAEGAGAAAALEAHHTALLVFAGALAAALVPAALLPGRRLPHVEEEEVPPTPL